MPKPPQDLTGQISAILARGYKEEVRAYYSMPRQWVRPIKPDELESPVPGLFSFRLQRDSEDFGRLYITLRIKQHFSPRTAPVSWTHIRSAITSDSNSPQAWDEALAAGER